MASGIEGPRLATVATYAPPRAIESPRVALSSTPTRNMSAQGSGDAMDVSSPTSASAPGRSNDNDADGKTTDGLKQEQGSASSSSSNSQMPAPPPAAAAAVHQPKIVQTAFIHKLYNMLEDPNIQHLISWSSSAESFIMSPSADFSKVLSQYFKHTNISSFVRQLNMYGFHKERDVFHTGSPDTTLWEFKHGNGNFKRGDIAGLREIKRRASRHALVHRENNFPKPPPSQPGTPAEPVQLPPETTDARLASLEHHLYDISVKMQRSDERAEYLVARNQATMETLARVLHFNQELTKTVMTLVTPDSSVHREVMNLQSEMIRQADFFRTLDDSHEFSRTQPYYSEHGPPVSPRQLAQDDSRRNTLAVPQAQPQAQARGTNYYRPSVPSNLSSGARRPFGSISGTSPTHSSPLRNTPIPPPVAPQPSAEPHPSLARRHTSADIRAHGWQAANSQYTPSQNPPSAPWPSSPSRVPPPDDQRLRESLSSFSLQGASQAPAHSSRPTTPPPPFSNGGPSLSDTFGSWSWNSAVRDKNPLFKDSSAPSTRRGSMAHILNPSDTAERSDEDDERRGEEDRKRKRLQ